MERQVNLCRGQFKF